MKREVEQKNKTDNKEPPKLQKIVLCYRCELKDKGGRNESVVGNFENPIKDPSNKMSIGTSQRLAYLANEEQRID
jgi:hypothetical protein